MYRSTSRDAFDRPRGLAHAAGLIAGIAAAVTTLVGGCGGAPAFRAVQAVPNYHFPEEQSSPSLQLVSLLADPYGDRFAQGGTVVSGSVFADGLIKPVAVARGADSELYVLDGGRGLIFALSYDASGNLIAVDRIDNDGVPFPSALDIALTPDAALWVTDSRLARVGVRRSGRRFVPIPAPQFQRPVGIAYHPGLDRVLVADLAANAIVELTVGGAVASTHAAPTFEIETPSFLAVGPGGEIAVVEALSGLVKVFGADWRERLRFGGTGDGPGYFARPKGVAIDSGGRIYVADALFDNVQVFDETGDLLMAVGTTGEGPAEFWQPMGLAVDRAGRLFIADAFNRRVQVFVWNQKG